jgi:hypothetical protein
MITRIKNVMWGLGVGAIGGALSPFWSSPGHPTTEIHSKADYLITIIAPAVVCAIGFGIVNPQSRHKKPDDSTPTESAGDSPHEENRRDES